MIDTLLKVIDKKPEEGFSQAEKLVAELSTYNGIHIGQSVLEDNEEIAKKFNVESFPSVVVIRPDSDPLVIATPDFTEDLSILYDTFTEQLGIRTSHNWSQQKHMGDFALEIKG